MNTVDTKPKTKPDTKPTVASAPKVWSASLRLVTTKPDQDLIKMLEELLSDARDGVLIGVAAACVFTKKQFFTPVAGICLDSPTFARGVVACLDDELADMIHERDPFGER